MLGFLFNKKEKEAKNKEKILSTWLKQSLGIKPKNFEVYFSIFSSDKKKHKERMELLGDSVMSLATLEYLLKKYPNLQEGELTQIKSRLVSRKQFNAIGEKAGINELCKKLQYRSEGFNRAGNLLESIMGAVYMDKGFEKASEIFQKNILNRYCNVEKIIKEDDDYKSKLIKICQKNKWKFEFKTDSSAPDGNKRKFFMKLFINNELISEAQGYKKKKIEQNLCYHALKKIEKK